MKPTKRSFTIAGHRTSISLEAPFWDALRSEARRRSMAVAALVAEIDRGRGAANLSSAVRVWLFERARSGDVAASTTATPSTSAAEGAAEDPRRTGSA